MKRLLIFDAFGTLISTGNGSVEAARRILSLQEQSIDPVRFCADWKKYHRRHTDWCNEHYFLPESAVFEKDLQALYEDYAIDRPYEQDVAVMLDTLGQRGPFPETKAVIDKLRSRFRVVIGSTTDTEPLMANLRRCELEVDEVYTSEMLGWYKPAEQFYRAILRLEGCTAEEAVFIGDSLVDDVYGPANIGMDAVLVDRTNKYDGTQPGAVIADLNGLLEMFL